jgi:phasin family protein
MNTTFASAQKSSTQIFESVQKLAQFNLETLQASFAEAAKTTQALMAVKSPQEAATLMAAEFKAAPEKAAAYGKKVQDIFTASSK